jgi:hypothetical protein
MSRTDGVPTLTERDLAAIGHVVRRIVREEVERVYDDLLSIVRQNGGDLAERLQPPAAWCAAHKPFPPCEPVAFPTLEAMRQALGPILGVTPAGVPVNVDGVHDDSSFVGTGQGPGLDLVRRAG